MNRAGTRGGYVRSVEEARALQLTHKPEWSSLIRSSIEETLREKGTWHADDLAVLDVPPEHANCIGAQVSALVNRGCMVEVGRRRGSAAASNGRKSGIFEITELGRKKLTGSTAGRPSMAIQASRRSGELAGRGSRSEGAPAPIVPVRIAAGRSLVPPDQEYLWTLVWDYDSARPNCGCSYWECREEPQLRLAV